MSDRIANIINKLENAGKSENSSVTLPYSNLTWAILKVLEKNGFVGEVSKKVKKGIPFLWMFCLKKEDLKLPAPREFQRIPDEFILV